MNVRTAANYIAAVTASTEALAINNSNDAEPVRSVRAHWRVGFLLTSYGIMFLLCVTLIVYLRFNRSGALKGDANAARKIILPAFESLLWMLTATTGVYSTFFITALATNYYKEYPSTRDIEAFYCGRQFVFVVVVVFMLQSSVSGPALRRAVLISLLLSTYTIPIVWTLTAYYNPTTSAVFWWQAVSRVALSFFFIYVYVRPSGRAKRTPLRQFCVLVLSYDVFMLASALLEHSGLRTYSDIVVYFTITWASFAPLLIWRVLKVDTEFWRGLGERACSLHHMGRQQTHIDERVSSRGLHLLIEMHRQFVIDFAHLELKKRIGVGVNSVVFTGVLESRMCVAAKVYTPLTFTEDTIASFSHEAALCATLHHPNIVEFYGMCVCPPTICLVSELCQGSLDVVMIAIAARDQPSQRQQSLIDLGYMIDAARALAYIHSFSPPFLHRDVKPANFLIDKESNVKLTDFGASRSLPRERLAERTLLPRHDSAQPMLRMTVTGTVDYMAPEMIRGRAGVATYGEAADVYSLAITFWDILNPGCDRYPRERSNPMLIFESVVDGTRPDLDIPMHARLRDLIANAWQTDPSLRPTTRHIVTALEGIQEELLATFASELSDEFERSGLPYHSPGPCREKFFTGEYAIERMEDCKYVSTSAEGRRLGNALMDAGFLHHLSHAQSFADSDAMYYFDEDNVTLYQPFAMLEADIADSAVSSENELGPSESVVAPPRRKASITASPKGILSQLTASLSSSSRSLSKTAIVSTSDATSGSTDGSDSSRCPCSHLAQRLELASRPPRRRHHRSHPSRRKCAPILEEANTLELRLLNDLDDDEWDATPTSSRGNRSHSNSVNSTGDSQHHYLHDSVPIAA